MRVISGTARSTQLKGLEGIDTRPTIDRVKEAVFSIIQFDIPGRRVLDLFAGTGQMGIEALSRGAGMAVFVDNNDAAIKVIFENLNKTKLAQTAKVLKSDYKAFLNHSASEGFDIIFLDPPYDRGLVLKALTYIDNNSLLNQNGIIVCESDKNEELPLELLSIKKRKEYFYGRVKVTIFEKKEG